MKYLLDKHPGMELSKKTFFIKKALKKHLEKGTIKQVTPRTAVFCASVGLASPVNLLVCLSAERQRPVGVFCHRKAARPPKGLFSTFLKLYFLPFLFLPGQRKHQV